MPRKQFLQTVAALAFVLILFGIVGGMDAEDAEASADLYCQMVKDRVWPDYQGIYLQECRNGTSIQNR